MQMGDISPTASIRAHLADRILCAEVDTRPTQTLWREVPAREHNETHGPIPWSVVRGPRFRPGLPMGGCPRDWRVGRGASGDLSAAFWTYMQHERERLKLYRLAQ